MGIGNCFTAKVPRMHIEASHESFIIGKRLFPTLIRKPQDLG